MPVLNGPDAAIKTNVLLLSQTATIYNGNITFSHRLKFTNDGKVAQLPKHQRLLTVSTPNVPRCVGHDHMQF